MIYALVANIRVLTFLANEPQVDIYSLGMVLYECLTRSTPWSGFTNMAQMVFQVAIQASVQSGLDEPADLLWWRSSWLLLLY
jgi:serine/threonine protein kinase